MLLKPLVLQHFRKSSCSHSLQRAWSGDHRLAATAQLFSRNARHCSQSHFVRGFWRRLAGKPGPALIKRENPIVQALFGEHHCKQQQQQPAANNEQNAPASPPQAPSDSKDVNMKDSDEDEIKDITKFPKEMLKQIETASSNHEKDVRK